MLEVVNIHKTFKHLKHELHVLKGIHLTVKESSIFSIVGPSGAGKSTLLHILGGLDRPSEGQVILDGEKLYELSDTQRARIRNKKIGFVFQFYHLLPEFTALENVLIPALVSQESKTKELETRAADLLSEVGLKDRLTHKPNQLSGGEQQRVAIARALINRPKIIFCDEPTGNLDSETGQQIVNLLMGLNKKNRQTLVIVTHDEQIAKLSHQIVRMKDGMLVSA